MTVKTKNNIAGCTFTIIALLAAISIGMRMDARQRVRAEAVARTEFKQVFGVDHPNDPRRHDPKTDIRSNVVAHLIDSKIAYIEAQANFDLHGKKIESMPKNTAGEILTYVKAMDESSSMKTEVDKLLNKFRHECELADGAGFTAIAKACGWEPQRNTGGGGIF